MLNALWSNHLKANKKVMSLETKCWHLEWKVEYLEKKLKQIDPNVGLYERDEDDPYEKEKKRGTMDQRTNEAERLIQSNFVVVPYLEKLNTIKIKK